MGRQSKARIGREAMRETSDGAGGGEGREWKRLVSTWRKRAVLKPRVREKQQAGECRAGDEKGRGT